MAEELQHKIMRAQQRLAEAEAGVARVVGRIEGAYDLLQEDPVNRELPRAKAWLQHDPGLLVTYDGSAVKGLPGGWPESVPNPDEHVAADVATRRDAHVERLTGSGPGGPPEPVVTPSVARFRAMTGGDGP